MSSASQWQLFGYDMRQLGQHWLGAWRELLWGMESPLRRHLDEVVAVNVHGERQLYQAGEPLAAGSSPASTACDGIALPDELVLCKRLSLPAAVESNLPAVLAMEVAANSPFAADDTAWGWRVVEREEPSLGVELAIAARSAIMAHLGRTHGSHDPAAQEVWAPTPDGMVVLEGFGEHKRELLYRRRLFRVAAMAGGVLVALLALAAIFAGGKQLELSRVQALATATERAAGEVTELRASLARANEQLGAAREIVAGYPNPHTELARLTRLLGDDAWVAHFSANGELMRIRGRAANAAAVMQGLSADPAYAEVTAPQAISRVGNTGQEQFYLDIRIDGDNSP